MFRGLKLSSRQVALVSTFIAMGAVVRVVVDQVGDVVPSPVFGIVIKFGLSETLSFVSGFVYGPVVGFLTGFLIILLSDIASPFGAGAWTPFIGSIIGLLGLAAAFIRHVKSRPTFLMMTASAVGLTLLSEFLQNLYVSLAYGVPIVGTMMAGLLSLVAAMVNNIILFPTVGTAAIEFVQQHHLQTIPANSTSK